MTDQEKSKIIIDEDWKSQVERERDELSKKPEEEPQPSAAAGEIPPASFPMLVSSIGTQAMMALGQVADPETGKGLYHPELARHHIDTLAVLQEKTAGNLTTEEAKMLEDFVHELRQLFIVMQNRMAGAPPPTPNS